MAKLILLMALLLIGYMIFSKATSSRRTMSPADARALLGLQPDATPETVREAHRRLIAKVHPDSGGSADLAARVNLARDTLIGEANKVSD